jgi:dTDP-4-amino-4,6-dideoxygalactose transaminase
MPDYGPPDLYRSPRYSPDFAEAMRKFTTSPMWDDWDLDGLLVDVPMGYAAKAGAKFGIFCSTGTAGLHASLMALPLKPGDEVIVPAMTFIRCATALVHLGLVPVLADIDPDTGNLDPESIASAVSNRTRAVLVVHMWGIPADMSCIVKECSSRGLFLIEDFSHAHFSGHADGVVGSFGDVAFASMQRKKTLSVGEGGLVFTNNESTYHRLREITSPGSFKGTPNYNEFSGFGLNLRMSPFSSFAAKELLADVDTIVQDRSAQARAFDDILGSFREYVEPPLVPDYVKFVSAYGYKPKLGTKGTLTALRKANSSGLWKFSEFSYGHLKEDVFWKKNKDYYPFCQGILPRLLPSYPGYDRYVQGRIGLSVPTVGADYWTPIAKEAWTQALRTAVS